MSVNHGHKHTPGGRTMLRRDFLAQSGAWAASPLFLPSLNRWGEARSGGDVCAAYWPGVEALEEAPSFLAVDEEACREAPLAGEADGLCNLAPAQAAGRGDARFTHAGANISIQGVIPPQAQKNGASNKLCSISVQADFRPFQDVSFYAWQYDCRHVSNISSPSRFTMPIDRRFGLNLSIELLEANGGRTPERRTLPIRLGLDAAKGSLPLRRGVYLIAWSNPQGGCRPDWSEVQVQNWPEKSEEDPNNYYRLLRRRSAAGIDFPYLAISVDYAGAADCV